MTSPRKPRAALEDLLEDIATLNMHGRTTPCQPNPRPWISERPADTREAAEACHHCPVITQCREAGRQETAGVWGGHVRALKPTQRKTAA